MTQQAQLKLGRDTLMLLVGLGAAAYALYTKADPAVWPFVGSLLAGPLALRGDEAKKGSGSTTDADEKETAE